jgi:lipoate-protein ligase A
VETVAGASEALLEPPASYERAVRFLVPTDRAVVLGSTQPASHIDPVRAATASVQVVRRRTGGSAVLVAPGRVLWADITLPAGDALWSDDVGRAFWWLGDAWAAALAAAGVEAAAVWRGGMVTSPWSDRICFAGLGPGEVTVGPAKVVGMSQRRTRAGALFQCALAVEWDPSELVAVLALDDDVRPVIAGELAKTALGVGAVAARRVPDALLAALP